MSDKGVTRPPRWQPLSIFFTAEGGVVVASLLLDNVLLDVASVAFAIFSLAYFLRYYMRTGRNVIEDSYKAWRKEL